MNTDSRGGSLAATADSAALKQVTAAFGLVALMWALTAIWMNFSAQSIGHFELNHGHLAALILTFDFPHQVFTLRRVNDLFTSDKIEGAALVPVAGLWLVFALAASLASKEFLLCTLSYFTLHHNLKQQQAWFIKGRQDAGHLPRISEFLHFSCMISAILYWHVSSLGGSFIFENDLIDATPLKSFAANFGIGIEQVFQTCCFATAPGAFGLESFLLLKHKNYLRIFALCGTASSWVFGVAVLQSKVFFAIFNILSHSLPYIVMASFSIKSGASESSPASHVHLVKLAMFYLLAFVFAHLYVSHAYEGLSRFSSSHKATLQDALQNALFCLIFLLPLLHYFSDAVIWRKARIH